MIRVVIIGAGNVAQHLYKAFGKTEYITVVQCYNRSGNTLGSAPVTNDINNLTEADVYIIAISDDAIEKLTDQLPFKNRLVVHTSGSVPMQTINNTVRRGVFYPLQTFSKNKTVDFKTIPMCLEAENDQDFDLLQNLAKSISDHCYSISSEQRSILHVAAVFINNFTNHMFTIGSDICNEYQIPFEILQPLILETADKIKSISPSNAQTGPAKRNDTSTINRHLSILNQEQQKEIYILLTKAIQNRYGKKL